MGGGTDTEPGASPLAKKLLQNKSPHALARPNGPQGVSVGVEVVGTDVVGTAVGAEGASEGSAVGCGVVGTPVVGSAVGSGEVGAGEGAACTGGGASACVRADE